MREPHKIFYLAAPRDAPFLDAVEKHLAVLVRRGLIEGWHAGALLPGTAEVQEIKARLLDADIIVVLISADLLGSEDASRLLCMAVARHDAGQARLIPVIVRPSPWQLSEIGGLPVLPVGGALSTAADPDAIWLEVVMEIERIVRQDSNEGDLTATNPYRGLEAFGSKHRLQFFGREELTRDLWRRLYGLQRAGVRLLCVLGPSGAGKSSLIHAGLLPLVAEQPFVGATPHQVAVMTPGARPIWYLAVEMVRLARGSLVRERAQEAIEQAEQTLRTGGSDGLCKVVSLFVPDRPARILLVVDQFEELYVRCSNPDERDLFIRLIHTAAADPDLAVTVLLSLRDDFYQTTAQHPVVNQLIAKMPFLVPVMSNAQLRRAIEEPARAHRRPLDDGTIRLLLSQSEGRPALPLLEFALAKVWDGVSAGRRAGDVLDDIGGVGGALAAEAEHIFAEFNNSERAIARRAFLHMAELRDSARPMRRRVLAADLVTHGEQPDQVLHVLHAFADASARLITVSQGEALEGAFVEVTHEALFEHWTRLRSWLETEKQDRAFHQRVTQEAEEWQRTGRPHGQLYRSPRLERLRELVLRQRDDMTSIELAFFERSLWQARLDWWRAWCVTTLGLLLAFIAAWQWWIADRRLLQIRQGALLVAGLMEKIQDQLSASAEASESLGSEDPRRSLAKQAGRLLESLGGALLDERQKLRAQTSRHLIEGVQAEQEDTLAAARSHYEGAAALARRRLGLAPGDVQATLDLIDCHLALASLLPRMGESGVAERELAAAHLLIEPLPMAGPLSTETKLSRSFVLHRLGDLASEEERLDEALKHHQRGLRLREEVLSASPHSVRLRRGLGVSHERVALVLQKLGRYAEAEVELQEVLGLREALTEERAHNAGFQTDLAIAYRELADLAQKKRDYQAARSYSLQARIQVGSLVDLQPQNKEYRSELARDLERLAYAEESLGEKAAAKRAMEGSIEHWRLLMGADAGNVEYQIGLAQLQFRLGRLHVLSGDLTSGRAQLTLALKLAGMQTQRPLSGSQEIRLLRIQAEVEDSLGEAANRGDRYEEAEIHVAQALALWRRLGGRSGSGVHHRLDMVRSWFNLMLFREALRSSRFCEDCRGLMREVQGAPVNLEPELLLIRREVEQRQSQCP